jgi:hypothetical protein
MPVHFIKNMWMKFSSIFLLAALVATIFSPVGVRVSRSRGDHKEQFVSVDVCSGSDYSVSAVADIPALHESPCVFLPLHTADCFEAVDASFASFLFSVPIERPPKV